MARKKRGIPGVSFSLNRALGISAAKGKLSRQIGIPLTRSGRQRKMGRSLGCCIVLVFIFGGFWAIAYSMIKIAAFVSI